MDAIPLLDLKPQHDPLRTEFLAAFERIIDSSSFILGEEVRLLEEQISADHGVPHAIALSSGTDALLVALMALDIGPGDEVICPDFTFFATAGAVARLGATPIFADVCPISFNMPASEVARLITPATKAVIPVHLFGQMAEMEAILNITKPLGIAVIEDAAQSMGASLSGKHPGQFGDAAAFSFYPTKNLGAAGDAGMLITTRDDLARRFRMLRNHGMENRYYHEFIGGNFRCDHIQGAILRIKYQHYADYNHQRAEISASYTRELSAIPNIATPQASASCCLGGDGSLPEADILLPVTLPHREHLWNQFTLRVRHGRRDALRAWLAGQKIASEVYYPLPLSRQRCFPNAVTHTPVTDKLCQEVLSLPIYPGLPETAPARIAALIHQFLHP